MIGAGIRSVAACALAMIGLLSGCGEDPLRPGDVAGTYVLRDIAGTPVPVTLDLGFGARLMILADTLQLVADGTASQTVVSRLITEADPDPTPFTGTVALGWRTRGGFEATVICETCNSAVIRGRFVWGGLQLTEPADRFYHRVR